ncbi:MAG TPA: hypothetical protein VIF15_08475 [Polyangiaceae bacterium]|jgi:hypothetical protein
MRGRHLPRLAVVAFALAPACSGAASSELLSAGAAGAGASDAGAETSEQGGGADASSQPEAQPPLDSGGGVQDAGLPETGVTDSGGAGGGMTIFCPPSPCAPPAFCCVTGAGQGNPPKYACETSPASCNGNGGPGTTVHCDRTADCAPGDVCCGSDYNGFYSDVSCRPQQQCGGNGQGFQQVQFCDPHVGDCPQGTTCQPSQVLPGYSVCN